jgi:ribose transport system substrate-binding protein
MKRIFALLMVLCIATTIFAAGSTETKDTDDGQKVVGFANIDESVDLQIAVRESIVRKGEELGLKIITANNRSDGSTAVRIADDMITMDVDAFVEFNVDESVAPVIMEKMNEAGIPVFAIDIPHPGAAFFGANNLEAGKIAGRYLAEQALEKWDGQIDYLLLVDQMASGEMPRQRILGYIPGIQEKIPGFSEDKVVFVEGGAEANKAQQVVADFLSAHPNSKHILIGTLHDVGGMGAWAAAETAGRTDDVLMVVQNEYAFLNHIKANPEEDGFVGAVAYFFDRYGDFLMPAVKKVLDGGPMPENVYVEHELINRENAREYFPDFF